MPVHRLVPIDPKDPDWRASTHRDVAVVRAGSEEQARSPVAEAFDATPAKPWPGAKVATPLRRRSRGVRAGVIRDQLYRSEGPAGILEPWGHG
jgi:hypothetical protein